MFTFKLILLLKDEVSVALSLRLILLLKLNVSIFLRYGESIVAVSEIDNFKLILLLKLVLSKVEFLTSFDVANVSNPSLWVGKNT